MILLGCAVYVVCGIRAGVADTMLVTHDRFARDCTVTPRQGVLDTATLHDAVARRGSWTPRMPSPAAPVGAARLEHEARCPLGG